MSDKIDERVVAMKFQNGQFEKGVADSLKSLDQLKKGMNMDGAKKGLDDLARAAAGFNLLPLGKVTDGISAGFVAMATLGVTALQRIASAAITTGTQMVKALTVDPINAGLKEYETNLNAIQTILANTQSKGTTLDNVNDALQQLNNYSDKTIYNFSEMARNIGTFTAAGVNLETSVNAIKGIANLAAVSGSNAQQASTAMYQLSQALSTGTVRLLDWNSVVNAGMGGELFQTAIKETARVHGVAVDDIIKKNGSFRDSLQEGWLTSEILTETLSKLTGDLTDVQLKAMGYTDEQIIGIQKMAKTAQDAATKVKTATQLIGTLQETAGSGWAQTFQLIFGDFEEAKTLWTGVNDVIGGMINASSKARNKMFKDWRDLGGRTLGIAAVKNAFEALMSVIEPIKDAFRDIFPPMTGARLQEITKAVLEFTKHLKLSDEAQNNLKRTFKGVFAVFDIVFTIIGKIVGVLFDLFGATTKNAGGVLEFTANIGDFLVKLRDAIKGGDGLSRVFKVIGDVLRWPIDQLTEFTKKLAGNNEGASFLENAWNAIANAMKKVWEFLKPVVDWFVDAFHVVSKAIKDAFKEVTPETLLVAVGSGALVGVFVVLKKFSDKLIGAIKGVGGGFIKDLRGIFGALTDTLKAMQMKIKTDALMKMAIAIAILAGSITILSLIEPPRLYAALSAVAVSFGLLAGALILLDHALDIGKGTWAKLPVLTASVGLLALAMLALAGALAIMGQLDIGQMGVALLGLAGSLGILIGALKLMEKINSAEIVKLSAALLILSVGLLALAGALNLFAKNDIAQTAIGLGAMAVAIGIVIGLMKLMEKVTGAVKGAAALAIVSGSLVLLGLALKMFIGFSWDEMARGGVVLAGSLAILAGALTLLGLGPTIQGALALGIAAVGLAILGKTLKEFTGFSWDELARGGVALAGTLAILAGAMALMGLPPVLLGSVGLLAAGVALMMIAPAIKILSSLSWDQVGVGMAVLASTLGILAGAGILLIPAVPGLLGAAAAILLFGVGTLAASVGILAFSVALVALAGAGTVGMAAFKLMIVTLIGLIPAMAKALAEGFVEILKVIANSGVEITAALVTLFTSIIEAIATVTPLIIKTLVDLIMLLLQTLLDNVPKMVDMGLKLLIGILEGIQNNIGKIVEVGIQIIINLLDGIAKKLPDLIDAAMRLVLSFINGVGDGIKKYSGDFVTAGSKLFRAIVDGVAKAIEQGGADLAYAGRKIGNALLNGAKKALGIASPSKEFFKVGVQTILGLTNSLAKGERDTQRAGEGVGDAALDGVNKSLGRLGKALGKQEQITLVITPVLDLSQIKQEDWMTVSALFGNTARVPQLSIARTRNETQNVDTGYEATRLSNDPNARPQDTPPETIKYEQNIYSPKPVNTAEVYRNTKNLVSQAEAEREK